MSPRFKECVVRLSARAAIQAGALCTGLILLEVAAAPASELNLNGMWLQRAWKRVDPVEGTRLIADRGIFIMALRHDRRSGEVRGVRVNLPPGSMPKGYYRTGLGQTFVGRIDGDSIVRTTTSWALPDASQRCPTAPAYGFRIGKGGRELDLLLVDERDRDGFGCPIHTDPELVKARTPPRHGVFTFEALYIVREVRFVEADAAPGTEGRPLKTLSAEKPFRVEVLFDLAPTFPIYATLSGRSGPIDVIVKATDRADVFQSDIIRIRSQR
jgi:hypothetical protein